MKIEERLIRHNQEDIIVIGEIMEKFYSSQAGTIMRAFINGHICDEAKRHYYEDTIPADRVLGRIEGFQIIIDDVERAIQDKAKLTEPLTEGGVNDGES